VVAIDSAFAARKAAEESARVDSTAAAEAFKVKFDAEVARRRKVKRHTASMVYADPLILTIGAEVSNASDFDQTKVSPALAVSVVGAGLRYKKLNITLALVAQRTQGATVREFRSCHVSRTAVAGVPVPGAPSGEACSTVPPVADTAFGNLLTADSVRFSTAGVWRAFAQSRIEVGKDTSVGGVRVGGLGGFGIQSNPNNLTDPRQQQLKVLWAVGAGIRQMTDSGTEQFAFDIVYGPVQNYFQVDRLGPAGSDGSRPVVTDPGPPRRTNQWQAFLTLRPIASFRLRLMTTLGAPAPKSLGEPPVPDLARLAVLTDRKLGDIVKALVGGKKDEEENSTATPADTTKSVPDANAPTEKSTGQPSTTPQTEAPSSVSKTQSAPL
jgi:hypothetical protein